MDTIKVNKKQTALISDGGYSLLEVNNTYDAFLAAANRTYDGVKCDLRFTKDRHLVTVRHRDLRHLINQKIHVSKTDYNHLSSLCIDERNNSYLTLLSDFIKICIRYRKLCCIELKRPIGLIELNQLLKVIEDFNYLPYFKIISSDLMILKQIRNRFFDIGLELLANHYSDDLLQNATKYHLDLTFKANLISSDLIGLCHECYLKVGTFNINNPVVAQMLIDMGIDYFYTTTLE